MAPTLTSNSFVLTAPPRSKLIPFKNSKFTVFAKKSGPGPFPPFRLGNASAAEEPTSGENGDDGPANFNPFRFNFGKIPDVKSLVPVMSDRSTGLSFGNTRMKDPGTVFVAGATGQAGVRIAQQLLRGGFSVRAGVPELGAAQELARLAAQYKIISNEELKRLNAVESTLQDAESIAKAIGNASKVVVTIGPAEYGPTMGVTTSDALQVIQAAELAGVGHVAIVYDGNTATSTYNVLDGISSFFNNLFSRSQPLTMPEFLQKLAEFEVSYTLIKTSLTEDYSPESSYSIVVAEEGRGGANDYKVAKSQIASLVAGVFSNTAVAENKVVEVSTDPSAPSRPIDELFSAIPEDGRRKEYKVAVAKARAEEEARIAAERAQEAAKAAQKLEEEVKKLSEQEAAAASLAEEAKEKAEAAGISMEGLFNKAKDFRAGLNFDKLGSELANSVRSSVEKPKVQIATVRGQAKARSLTPTKALIKQPRATPKPKPAPALSPEATKEELKPKPKQQAEPKKEVRKVFGGLFQQETIYIDDD
ncbi:protein PLASTID TRANSCRIPTIONALLY ACTIVE 16, chloroplastic [Eucalyptus grandis]|uniref:protein PLASTID TRANSCRIPTIONALLY ACTIVE 16, chloroplastic n=1 Tax=Eucalyptus grandis TaxID=71139 RepID=UPI00192EC30C|nr:protein PLASTID TRANSCRIPTIONALLY ACTIVE 16, chloroplastic [Eucalyptus grandis]XP_018724280.2 protein PLASTID TRANSCRIPTIONALLY ACTIVE 16, chloroplastic [Eucalyptus grandis]